MSAFTYALGMTLMHFLWQGLLLGCATAVLLTLLRNSRAEYRYLAACCALLACLGWPAFDLWQRLASGALPSSASFQGLQAAYGAARELSWFDLGDALRHIVSLWALCATVLALRMLIGLLWIERVSRQQNTHPGQQRWEAELAQLAQRFGITRAVRLRVTATLASPVTADWWRPVVLVPASLLSGMPQDLLHALLAHEMAHIKRHDYAVNLLQNVIETLLFYHPAVWWISRRIRVERELIADHLAAQQLGEPRRLALALSELEKLRFADQQLALAASGGDLVQRIQHLLRPVPQSVNWKAACAMLAVAAACVSIYAQATVVEKRPPAITAALVDFRSCAKPVWPAGAIAAERTGMVQLAFQIDADGHVSNSKVDRSSGHSDLDEAARIGIGKCQFSPATRAGKPFATWQKMQYVWTLE
nr:M56 family metallopeptidase [uncultured Duganella sp.]